MIIKIEVTQEDIDKGIQASCHLCPVAIAAQRTIHDSQIQISSSCLYKIQSFYSCKLPTVVRQFICDFDCGNSVQPFTFEIEIP